MSRFINSNTIAIIVINSLRRIFTLKKPITGITINMKIKNQSNSTLQKSPLGQRSPARRVCLTEAPIGFNPYVQTDSNKPLDIKTTINLNLCQKSSG